MQHRSRSFLGAAASLTLLVGVAACGSDDKASTTTAERTTDSVERTDAATTTDSTEDSDDVSVPDDDEVSTTEEGEDVTTTADDTDGNDVDTSDWVVYESPEGTYSASFPSEPTTQTQNAPLPDGSTLALTIVSSQQGQTFFATASGVYPAAPPDVDAALQGAQDEAIKNVNGTLIESSDITVDGRPGRQFSAAVTQGGQDGTVVQRVVLDGANLFQSIVVAPKDLSPASPDVAAFFDSFTLTG